MTTTEFATYIRFKTKTNSTTFTDAQILLLANIWMKDLAQKIAEANEDSFGIYQTTGLVLNQREYPAPADLIKYTRVEAKLDGTNWLVIHEMDLNNYHRTTNETEIVNQFANQEGMAFYDIFRDSLWIYSGSIIEVTSGLKLWSQTYPAALTVLNGSTEMSVAPSSTSHGFPREFQELLARRVVIDFKSSKDVPIPLDATEQRYDIDLQRKLEDYRGMNMDRLIIASIPDSSDRGDSGFNY